MNNTITILVLALAPAFAAPSQAFFDALHHVETSGRTGAILGDSGRALGPLQIHRAYWQDANIGGRYEDCAGLEYSKRVVAAYLKRHAPAAWARGDVTELARVHNGGPRGHLKPATIPYARRVLAALNKPQ